MLKPDDFEKVENKGVRLKADARRVFFGQYHKKLHTLVYHPLAGRKMTYQKCFEIQAWQLRKNIEGLCDIYKPWHSR